MTLSGADAPALPKGELLCIFRAAQIKLPLSGELLSEAKLRGQAAYPIESIKRRVPSWE
jgi:hypothetical protein